MVVAARRSSFHILGSCALGALGTFLSAGPAFGQQYDGRLEGVQVIEQFGTSLSTGVDLDGDGVQDFAVGIPHRSLRGLTDNGAVEVYSGATRTLLFTIAGSTSGDLFGYAVALVPDVDGDGIGDLCVGALGDNGFGGSVTMFSGQTRSPLWTVTGGANSFLGDSLAVAGDLDGDGEPDVVVGAPGADTVYVFQGGTGAVLRTWTVGTNHSFGESVAGGVDVDGDGVADVVVGEPAFNLVFPPTSSAGRIQVFSGAAQNTVLFTAFGDAAGSRLGAAVAMLHDLDGDQGGEVVATLLPILPPVGTVRVFSSSGGTLYDVASPANESDFGKALCRVEDVSLDGKDDLAIGSWGFVHLVSGTVGAPITTIAAPDPDAVAFGTVIASADLDGNGHGDLWIASPFATIGGQMWVGSVDVYRTIPASTRSYGSGWPGTLGVPSLTCTDPGIGESLTLSIGNSRGATTVGFLLVGFQEIRVPTSADGILLVLPTYNIKVQVPTRGLDLSSSLPDDPSLLGIDLFTQCLELDPGASKGLSFTAGLRLSIGFDYP